MKCMSCNERKSSTRCEGCLRLFCRQCVNVHHDELMVEFEALFGIQNELKESLDVVQSNWQNNKDFTCLAEIDQWELEVINRIRLIAGNARKTANEMMAKHMSDIGHRLDQLTFDMEQRQQEGNYLDNDINEIRNQLQQLNSTIKEANEKIRINYSTTNRLDWNSLLHVTMNKKSMERKIADRHFDLSDFFYEEETTQDKIWKNIRKFIKNKHLSKDIKGQQSIPKCKTSSIFGPIVLTSIDALAHSVTKSHSDTYSMPNISYSMQQNSLQDAKSLNYVALTTNNYDQLLPQGSDA
ncbi:unnamed protein product [Rotaria magnacalcarata]|uniref:B box-type domain-containing protein n=3 Tax=Rotaria magnacalcarata TaxID=392030 RepID=A0A816RN61_9BILA|nr:unnamed protein product [Rotaria magnacalcarata]CAF2062375.1 unnamed protein product [Rotaria magnacalcarata]CAF2077690.1 unnamed protein product [Rotaria magnacalcarata]CAF3864172.1 unnamed protein product [Rotaria magnacalcarata]CAF5070845.1 unnamed protein product [Rotaria magnacalcarata]